MYTLVLKNGNQIKQITNKKSYDKIIFAIHRNFENYKKILGDDGYLKICDDDRKYFNVKLSKKHLINEFFQLGKCTNVIK